MAKQLEALIAEMKAAAEKATPKSWHYSPQDEAIIDSDSTVAIRSMDSHLDDETTALNAAHIAAADPENVLVLIAALEQAQQRVDDEICRANREHHRGFMMACKHLEEHANVHYADAAEVEIAALRNRVAELEASPLAVKLLKVVNTFDAAAAIRACMDEFPPAVQDVVEECAVIAENTIRAAGGTVEGE